MAEVRCPTCHRLEDREGTAIRVVTEGGGRRPVDPDRDAWPHLAAASRGECRVVGACPHCGQPLLADADSDLPGARYAIELAGLDVVLEADQTLHDPSGVLQPDEIAPLARKRWQIQLKPARTLFQTMVLVLGVGAPLSVFVAGLLGVSIFFWPIFTNLPLAWKLALEMWGFS